MTSILLPDSHFDYLFEDVGQSALDLTDCIDHVEKLHLSTASGTKGKSFYYTMWSTLCAQRDVLAETHRVHVANRYLHQEVRILRAMLLSLLDRQADLSKDDLVQRIIDALKTPSKTI